MRQARIDVELSLIHHQIIECTVCVARRSERFRRKKKSGEIDITLVLTSRRSAVTRSPDGIFGGPRQGISTTSGDGTTFAQAPHMAVARRHDHAPPQCPLGKNM
jgi:hypothetical protein